MSTSSYVVLKDGFHELKMSTHISERKWSHEFNLPPDALVDHSADNNEMAVFAVQLDPSSGADVTVNASINNTLIFQAHFQGGVNRSRVEVFRASLLRWQNNTVDFEVYTGHGSVKFGKVVLWFHTNPPGIA